MVFKPINIFIFICFLCGCANSPVAYKESFRSTASGFAEFILYTFEIEDSEGFVDYYAPNKAQILSLIRTMGKSEREPREALADALYKNFLIQSYNSWLVAYSSAERDGIDFSRPYDVHVEIKLFRDSGYTDGRGKLVFSAVQDDREYMFLVPEVSNLNGVWYGTQPLKYLGLK